jgi:hypothetical protein
MEKMKQDGPVLVFTDMEESRLGQECNLPDMVNDGVVIDLE